MKYVLFLCVENSCRSQIAEGIFNRHAPAGFRAISAGTKPAAAVNPGAVEVMKEIGIDISKQKPKMLDVKTAANAVKIISMGCASEKGVCPGGLLGAEDWKIEDPAGKPIGEFRKVRDVIKEKVLKLIGELKREKL